MKGSAEVVIGLMSMTQGGQLKHALLSLVSPGCWTGSS